MSEVELQNQIALLIQRVLKDYKKNGYGKDYYTLVSDKTIRFGFWVETMEESL